MRQTVKDLVSLPGPRRLQFDSKTGLSPELALVGFDRSRALAALPPLRERLRALGKTTQPGLRLYLAGLALAANDADVAEAELSAIESPPRALAEMADALRAQAMLVRGQKSAALSRMEQLRDSSLVTQRALIDYLTGSARLASGKGNPADGVLDLLNVAAVHGDDQPAIAAAALYARAKALLGQHDAASARAVQIELLRSFPETDHGAQLLSELGPGSAVAKAPAELEAAESTTEATAPSDTLGRGRDRARTDPKLGRKRPGRPKEKLR